MLMLVHPAREGQGTDPPAHRRRGPSPVLSLTIEESRHLRVAIVNTARSYGSHPCLAAAMGVPVSTLYNRKRHGAALALRLAAAAGISVEAVLGGKLSAAGRCATCGHRAGDGRLLTAGGAP